MGIIKNMIRAYKAEGIKRYIDIKDFDSAFIKYGLDTLVDCGILKAIPNSDFYYRNNLGYDEYGREVFNYVTHFANGNIVIYKDVEDDQKRKQRLYAVMSGEGEKKSEWFNNVIPSIYFFVLSNTENKIDKNSRAILIDAMGNIQETEHNVLCYPIANNASERFVQTRDIDKNGEIVNGFVLIDECCNVEEISPNSSTNNK